MKGLSCRFRIKDGKFELSNGVEKARDNIWFYCIFDKFRIYVSDFGADFVSLVQKPINYLVMNRTLILGSLKKGIQKYVPNVNITNIDIGYFSTDRKQCFVKIEYTSTQEDNTQTQDVMFV